MFSVNNEVAQLKVFLTAWVWSYTACTDCDPLPYCLHKNCTYELRTSQIQRVLLVVWCFGFAWNMLSISGVWFGILQGVTFIAVLSNVSNTCVSECKYLNHRLHPNCHVAVESPHTTCFENARGDTFGLMTQQISLLKGLTLQIHSSPTSSNLPWLWRFFSGRLSSSAGLLTLCPSWCTSTPTAQTAPWLAMSTTAYRTLTSRISRTKANLMILMSRTSASLVSAGKCLCVRECHPDQLTSMSSFSSSVPVNFTGGETILTWLFARVHFADTETIENRLGKTRSTSTRRCTGTFSWPDWLLLFASRWDIKASSYPFVEFRLRRRFFAKLKHFKPNTCFVAARSILCDVPGELLNTGRAGSREAADAEGDVLGQRSALQRSLLNPAPRSSWPHGVRGENSVVEPETQGLFLQHKTIQSNGAQGTKRVANCTMVVSMTRKKKCDGNSVAQFHCWQFRWKQFFPQNWCFCACVCYLHPAWSVKPQLLRQ